MKKSIIEVLAVCGLVLLFAAAGALQLSWQPIPINPADLKNVEKPLWAKW